MIGLLRLPFHCNMVRVFDCHSFGEAHCIKDYFIPCHMRVKSEICRRTTTAEN
jgi:hypothetical protein